MRLLKLVPILTLVLLMGCKDSYHVGQQITAKVGDRTFAATILNKTDTGYFVEICETKTTTCVDYDEVVSEGNRTNVGVPSAQTPNCNLSVKAQFILLGIIPLVLLTLCNYASPLFLWIAVPYIILVGSAVGAGLFLLMFCLFAILSIGCWFICYWLLGWNAVLGTIGYFAFMVLFLVH